MTRIVFTLTTALAVWSGCDRDTGSPPAPESNRKTLTATGTFEVSYAPFPDPIPLNNHFSVEVLVRPTDRSELPNDISIELDADMPAHGHGINTAPEIRRTESGTFTAEGMLFHMPGRWELYVDVVRGPTRDRATFPLILE